MEIAARRGHRFDIGDRTWQVQARNLPWRPPRIGAITGSGYLSDIAVVADDAMWMASTRGTVDVSRDSESRGFGGAKCAIRVRSSSQNEPIEMRR